MSLIKSISSFFGKKQDEQTVQSLTETLLMNDVSYGATQYFVERVKKNHNIEKEITQLLKKSEGKIEISTKPFIIFFYGINGSGKTSTIIKLTNILQKQGKSVLVAGCDTFRSAAPQQLASQLTKINCQTIIPQNEKTDPASIAFIASKKALEENFDVLIIDTAGRLHTNSNLMQELQKIHKVTLKNLPSSSHTNIAIMDATIGQNSISQINQFNAIIPISGIIITKMDTSAKGGAIVSIAHETKMKIYYLCNGTNIENISPFNAEDFSKAFLQ